MYLFAVAKNLTNDEMVKQMQEQVISIQDKQMAFLNNNISTTLTTISVVVGIIGLISVGLGTWIGLAHRSAKKKMNEAEVKMNEAKEKINYAESIINKADEAMERLETYREEVKGHKVETEEKFTRLINIIDNRMSTLQEVSNTADKLVRSHHTKVLLAEIETALDYAKERIEGITKLFWFSFTSKCLPYEDFLAQHQEMMRQYETYRLQQNEVKLEEIEGFYSKCLVLKLECVRLTSDVENFKYGNTQDKSKTMPKPLFNPSE